MKKSSGLALAPRVYEGILVNAQGVPVKKKPKKKVAKKKKTLVQKAVAKKKKKAAPKKRPAAKKKTAPKKRPAAKKKAKKTKKAKPRCKPCKPCSRAHVKKRKPATKKRKPATKKKSASKKHKHSGNRTCHRCGKKGVPPISKIRGVLVGGHVGNAKCVHCGATHTKAQHWSHLKGAGRRPVAITSPSYEANRSFVKTHLARTKDLEFLAKMNAKRLRAGK